MPRVNYRSVGPLPRQTMPWDTVQCVTVPAWDTMPWDTTPATSAPGLGSPLPHLRRDWARPCHICTWTGLSSATSAPGLGSALPHLHRDWAHRSHVCTGDWAHPRLIPDTSAPGLGPPLPRLRRNSALPHLRRDRARPLQGDMHHARRVQLPAPEAVWRIGAAESRRRCGRGGPESSAQMWTGVSPVLGADVAAVGPVSVQMWQRRSPVPVHVSLQGGWAHSRRRCGRGESSPGADVAWDEPSPRADVAGVSPVPGADGAESGAGVAT
jgi:hypothetical protein